MSSLERNWRFGKKYTSPRFPGRASLCLVHLLQVGAKWFSFKAGLKKIDMSDYILISRKNIVTRDFGNIKNSIQESLQKKPKTSVFQGGFTRVFEKFLLVNFPQEAFPMLVDQLHIDEPTHRKHLPGIGLMPKMIVSVAVPTIVDPSVFVEFFRETVRYKGGGR